MTEKAQHEISSWGYEHPSVKGPNALMFFTWDLSKTIENAFKNATEDTLDYYLAEAQKSIDELLQKYIDIEADPETFDGQSIILRLEPNEDSKTPLIALQTSPHLEDRIIKMQARVRPGHG
ncbi:hypothetical protein KU392_06180 [Advenella alkanexedens]|jgi:hypothetical protein|uniref:Uncharacterized protein n=1 Tax=Advenella alkanexedens TaxID=1481665 RepID=A0ABS6NMM2_9BURK|nr:MULTISPECIES: hypothetical protein [Advenella]MBV4396843.1 hypothetical protein [Advenella alkanexedens]MDD3756538.1 hypothetical protein [Advenella sp.]NLN68398.1 hypothetical protein [Alcaligenaceae bacterium]WKU20694.1 hypothetical protein Q3V95_06720 [Advenella alkanexedens]